MKRTLTTLFFSLSVCLFTQVNANAALQTMTWGTVNAVGVNGSGVATVSFQNAQGDDPSSFGGCYWGLFFAFENTLHPANSPATTLNRHLGAEAVLSILLTAKTSDQAVFVQYYPYSDGDPQSCLLDAVLLAPPFPGS